MTRTALMIRHKAKPGARDTLRAIWERHVPAYVAGSPGHLIYAYCEDQDDPDVIWAFQIHSDAGSADQFTSQPWYAAYHAETEALLAEPSWFHKAMPVWSKP